MKIHQPLFEKKTILNREQSDRFFEIIASIRSQVDTLEDDRYHKFLDKVSQFVYDAEDNDHKLALAVQNLFDKHITYRVTRDKVMAVLRDVCYPQRTIDAIVRALDSVDGYVLTSTSLNEASAT